MPTSPMSFGGITMKMDTKAPDDVATRPSVDALQSAATNGSSNVHGTSSEDTPLPGFLRLPAEVRNDIYVLCLPHHQRMSSDLRHIDKADRWAKHYEDGSMSKFGAHPGSVPALLQTCRTMREDALPIYYSDNGFILDLDDHPDRDPSSYSNAVSWLTAMDALALAHIARFQFLGTVRHVKLCKLVLDGMPDYNEELPKSTLHPWSMSIGPDKIHYEVGTGASCKSALTAWFASVADQGNDFARRRSEKHISPEQKKVELITAVQILHDSLSVGRHVPVKSASPLKEWHLPVVARKFDRRRRGFRRQSSAPLQIYSPPPPTLPPSRGLLRGTLAFITDPTYIINAARNFLS
ncbi:hypothetical protein LTR17_003017 [Elasticomyces elasticus]|nr:hypothetical protein LTR17_003017 [Elasticomyces elasticus]